MEKSIKLRIKNLAEQIGKITSQINDCEISFGTERYNKNINNCELKLKRDKLFNEQNELYKLMDELKGTKDWSLE